MEMPLLLGWYGVVIFPRYCSWVWGTLFPLPVDGLVLEDREYNIFGEKMHRCYSDKQISVKSDANPCPEVVLHCGGRGIINSD